MGTKAEIKKLGAQSEFARAEAARTEAEARRAEAEAKAAESRANAEAKAAESRAKAEESRIANEGRARQEGAAAAHAAKVKEYKEGTLGSAMGIAKPASFVAGALGGGLTAKGVSKLVGAPRGRFRALAALPYVTVGGIGLWKSRELAEQARDRENTPVEADANKATSNFLLGQAAGSASGGAKYVLKDIASEAGAKEKLVRQKLELTATKNAEKLAKANAATKLAAAKGQLTLKTLKTAAPSPAKTMIANAAETAAVPLPAKPKAGAALKLAKPKVIAGAPAAMTEKQIAKAVTGSGKLTALAKGRGGKLGLALAVAGLGSAMASGASEARAQGGSPTLGALAAGGQALKDAVWDPEKSTARNAAELGASLAFPVASATYGLGSAALENGGSAAGMGRGGVKSPMASVKSGDISRPRGTARLAQAPSGLRPGWSNAARQAAKAARSASASAR